MPAGRPRLRVAAIGAGAALLGMGAFSLVAARIGWWGSSVSPDGAAPDDDDAGLPPWCAEGLEPVNGSGCFAGTNDAGAPLLIYLHGIYDRDADAEERDRQRRVAKKAVARGFAVLALRGQEGGCSTSPELLSRVCWPSNESSASRGPSVVGAWGPALRAAATRGATGPRYLLGFSNGGFFVGLLAVRGWFPASGFAVANAGPVEPVRSPADKPPLLLLSADDDPSQDGMLRLDDELTREGWSHEHYAREGVHALTDDEIDATLTFFVRTRTEKLPLRPPLSTHRPRVREAGSDGNVGVLDAGEAPVPGTVPADAPSDDAAASEPE